MANVQPEQLDQLMRMLSEYHSSHAREHGAMETCAESACVEVKMGLTYLASKLGPKVSGLDPFNLK